jgi:lipopolysaccharide/colanic/teichoic acid biosynthesis glycosyltransferase
MRFWTWAIDLFLFMLATLVAILLRDNLEWSPRIAENWVYFSATAAWAGLLIPLSGLSRSIWRFSSLPDYQRIVVVVVGIVLCVVGTTFAVNRLEQVARSLPFLQALLAMAFMIGARVVYRMRQAGRQARKSRGVAPLTGMVDTPQRSVVIVGLNRLTEVYIQSIADFEPGRVIVVGLLGHADRHVGRLVSACKVLGVPENIEAVLRDLKVHGVVIDRVVVTTRLDTMSNEARSALLELEERGEIELQFLSETLGFDSVGSRACRRSDAPSTTVSFTIAPDQLTAIRSRRYWRIKRLTDAIAAGVLLLLLSPVMLLLAIAIAIEIGVPVAFRQQRPGLGGVPFHLSKFRTMSAAHDAQGRRRSDEERTSWLGNILRRTRLDELPQLVNILRGEMSFVGPRPLLPRDQAEAHSARLLVRPGLTGWAQVVGGRIISPDDKAALDVWYVKNASFALDVEIAIRTVRMIIAGEHVSDALVSVAWRDLQKAGMLRSDDCDAIDRVAHSAA